MGLEKQSSKSGGKYVGGFLQLFDWNGKSRKKLFAKSDLQGGSKQAKRHIGNFPTTRHILSDDDDNGGSSIRGSSDYSCASSITDDDVNGTKAPGVVARLMGLDSLPTPTVSEPYSTPFFNNRSSGDLHGYRNEFHNECLTTHSGNQPALVEGLCKHPADSRFQKLHNRPIERFQTEMLPPRLAKSIPVTHHKLLSPIKNPGFVSTKNAAHIMEAAAKIIEPGPQPSTKGKMPSVGSSSVPMKVRDLKEKMEAAQRSSRLNISSRRQVESNAVKYLKGQSMSKSWNGSEDPPRFRVSSESEESSSVGSRNKGKSVSLAVQAKTNVQRRETFSSSSSRSLTSQKEHQDVKSNQSEKSRLITQRNVQKKSSTQNVSSVLRQNNQKQNGATNRDKSFSKPSSNTQGRKALSGDASFSRNKTSTKVAANSKAGAKKINLDMIENEKEQSLVNQNFPRKKRSIESTFNVKRGAVIENILVDKDEKPVQTNAADTSRKGMDVVSFTFTSPMVKSRPVSQSSSPIIVDKSKSFSLDSFDERNTKLSSLGVNAMGGDALSILLERKLRELTYGVESSCSNSDTSGSVSNSSSILHDLVSALNAVEPTPREHNKRSHLGSNISSTYREMLKMNNLQEVEEMDSSNSISSEARKELECQHPSPMSILDPSFSIDSSHSSDTGENTSFVGNKWTSSSAQAELVDGLKCLKRYPLTEAETDLSDSASSSFFITAGSNQLTTSNVQNYTRSTKQEELSYIREIISNAKFMFMDFMSGRTTEIINPNLFDRLENPITSRSISEENNSRQRKKSLFDCTRECLDLRCNQCTGGGCRKWGKGVRMFVNKEQLGNDIYKEISMWESMGDWMMDELIDKDMSTQYGRWVDFEIEEFEEGIEIEKIILSSLIDELVCDISLV